MDSQELLALTNDAASPAAPELWSAAAGRTLDDTSHSPDGSEQAYRVVGTPGALP
jgi:hypothetical protein